MTTRVNPSSLQEYADHAQSIFNEVAQTLDIMVAQAANVNYQGANARQFNEDCLAMTQSFASAIAEDTTQIMNAIQASTEAISQSLGEMGAIVMTPPNLDAIMDPGFEDEGGGVVVLEAGSLQSYMGEANSNFDLIVQKFTEHQDALAAVDWEGGAQMSAMNAIEAYTGEAHTACSQARTKLIDYCEAQIRATDAVDV